MGSHIEDNAGRLSSLQGKALLAVSGGIDSMCLAAACKAAGVDFAVAHCNFNLRAEESDGDEKLVRDWCEASGVQLHVQSFETKEYAATKGISIEMAARELRYAWFAGLCREKGFAALVVAHNANDNAETLILNLLRGTGLKGLCGMAEDGFVEWQGLKMRIIRPLLSVSRADIEAYVKEKAVPFRDDSTNSETLYKRNKIRHKVFPVFSEINPSFLDTISADLAHLRQADAVLDDYFDAAGSRVLTSAEGVLLAVDIKKLLGEKHWQYLLFRLLAPYGFNESTNSEITGWLCSVNRPIGKIFTSSGEKYRLTTTATSLQVFENEEGFSVTVSSPGEYLCGRVKIRVSLEPAPSSTGLVQPLGTIILDASKIPFPFELRSWREGDWMKPFGMKGCKKKLSDVFTGLKMPLPQKQRAVVLSYPGEEGRAAAVVGLRIDDSMKVRPSTREVLRLSIAGCL